MTTHKTTVLLSQTKNKTIITPTNPNHTVITHSAVVGAKGDSGDVISIQAANDINAYTLVTHATNNRVTQADCNTHYFVIGMSAKATTQNNMCEIKNNGVIVNSGWNLTPNSPIYLGENGDISQTQNGLFSVNVGQALTQTSIFINIQQPIVRSL